MTLADRPQPILVLVRSILRGHLFAFVWLPREELSTGRRLAIGEMISKAADGPQKAWSVDLGDGDLALLRYTFTIDADRNTPDTAALNRKLYDMVRGFLPAMEERLADQVGAGQARRLTLTYGQSLPKLIARLPADARRDRCASIRWLTRHVPSALPPRHAPPENSPQALHARRPVPLSAVVPVLEFFASQCSRNPDAARRRRPTLRILSVHADVRTLEAANWHGLEEAIASVLRGDSENDASTSLSSRWPSPRLGSGCGMVRYTRRSRGLFGYHGGVRLAELRRDKALSAVLRNAHPRQGKRESVAAAAATDSTTRSECSQHR